MSNKYTPPQLDTDFAPIPGASFPQGSNFSFRANNLDGRKIVKKPIGELPPDPNKPPPDMEKMEISEGTLNKMLRKEFHGATIRKPEKSADQSTEDNIKVEEDILDVKNTEFDKNESPFRMQKPIPKDEKPPFVENFREETDNLIKLDTNFSWERIDAPSNMIPYKNYDELMIRKLIIPDLFKINRARQFNNNFTILIDAIAPTINIPIRKLTIPDFNIVVLWHRLNSYPRTPYTVTWTSIYGHEIESSVNMSKIDVSYLKMSHDEFMSYFNKGLSFPTVADREVFEHAGMNEETRFYFQHAQFISSDYPPVIEKTIGYKAKKHPYPVVQSRIDILLAGGVELMEEIRDFSNKINCGYSEFTKLQDPEFDPLEQLKILKEALNDLEKTDTSEEIDLTGIITLRTQIDEMEVKIKEGEIVEAKYEEVPLNFSVWSSFLQL